MTTRGRGAEATRRQVWDAAVRLFAAQGFHRTGIRELADAAGLSPATLYHHMGTKEDLLFAIVRTCRDRLVRAAERASSGDPCPQAVVARLVHVHVLTHALHRDETRVAGTETSALAPGHRSAVTRLRERYEDIWRVAVTVGCAKGAFSVPDRRHARAALLEMCSGVATWYSPADDDLSALASSHARLGLQMLGVPPGRVSRTSLPDAAGIRALVEETWRA